jgi:hypothetical protein
VSGYSGRCGSGALLVTITALSLVAARHGEAQKWPHFIAFRGDMGMETPRGDPDTYFQGNIRGEFSVLGTPSWLYPAHFGFGFSWISFPMEPGYPQEQWNYVGSHFALGLTLREWLDLPVYIEGRVIERRLRPMEERDRPREHPDALPIDTSTPFPEYQGLGLEGVAGIAFPFGRRTYFDAAARFALFEPRNLYLEEIGETLGEGWTFGLQIGLVWFP